MGAILAALAALLLFIVAAGSRKNGGVPPSLPQPPSPVPEGPTNGAGGELTETELGWLLQVDAAAEVAIDTCPESESAIRALRNRAAVRLRGSTDPETVTADAVFEIENECEGMLPAAGGSPERCAVLRAAAASMSAQVHMMRVDALATGDEQLLQAIVDLEKQAKALNADAARCEAEL